jgi:hypothetical protein
MIRRKEGAMIEFTPEERDLLYDDGEATHDELRAMLARSSAANGWDEPGMDSYDGYTDRLAEYNSLGVRAEPHVH